MDGRPIAQLACMSTTASTATAESVPCASVNLPAPTALSAVTVDLNSTGTVVHVRGVADKAPTTFADTSELSPPTPMQPGRNRIPVNSSAPVSGVLVWISTLGSADGKSQAAISEIELQAAAPPA